MAIVTQQLNQTRVNTIQYGGLSQPGATGPSGATGPAGQSIRVVGTVGTAANLPNPYTGAIGDGYFTTDTGHLWIWDGANWQDIGNIVGASGSAGATGIGETGASGVQGEPGATGSQGATGTGLTGATGISGATGSQGDIGATGVGLTGATGISGATGPQGASGADSTIPGATGVAGATGVGAAPITTFTTYSTDQVVVETIDGTLYRSVKYEMQLSTSDQFQATELRLLVDDPNVFLTQYGSIGDFLGAFSSFYTPLNNNYSSPNINVGGLSVWNGTGIRVYTGTNSVQLALLSIPVGTTLTLNGSVTAVLQTPFTQTSTGIYDAVSTITKSPTLAITNIAWTGSGNIELRFTPTNAVTTLKYIKTEIPV
jgi:hypothetical protein